jgi:hypothetical protein
VFFFILRFLFLVRSFGEVGSMADSYKPGPQAWYLVVKMSDSEKTLLDAVNKLSEKFDSYDKHLTTLGSDLSKV